MKSENILNPRKALNKAFLKIKPNRNSIELFKKNLISLLDDINESESEEFHKNLVSDFLKNTYYNPEHFINTKGRNDLVIHNGKDAKSSVGVIIEAKKPTNKSEMIELSNLNKKAFQELVLYFLRERVSGNNLEIKYLIAANIYEWFIFDANVFEKHFAQNKNLIKQFNDFEEGRLSGKTTDFFYKEIAEPCIASLTTDIPFTHFDIRDYDKPLRNENKEDDNTLISLFKLFSPEHLLKLPFANDSNSLDKVFYSELLHIIGLTEIKDGSKKLIERKKDGDRNSGSLIESAISQIRSLDKLSRIEKVHNYGKDINERLFNVALELSITWINRILFLKLLEAQLIKYNRGDISFSFLNFDKVQNFDDLNSLFFSVLACKQNERDDDVKKLFSNVPYLNSSLFEPTELEQSCFFISQLKDSKIPIINNTVFKDNTGKKKSGELNTLEYLFEFLNAYDFSSEGSENIQEDNKTLINASVLGLIFEKINGYKDGSFFTPGFITMYMCRETIRRAVVQKFNEAKGWQCQTIDDVYDKIDDKKDANTVINSLKICDPAVGSGHFLVSSLNEIISIKSDLRILIDRQGKTLRDYHIEVVNDELIVTDDDGNLFEYNPKNKESQRIQEALFHEKETIIENCLFGVDINSNSVKICRLRLWIELLKNAYYKSDINNNELETLPNIDINIKCGNSLVSRHSLDIDIKEALRKVKNWSIESYRDAVMSYRNAQSKDEKRKMEKLISDIKSDFSNKASANNKDLKRLENLKGKLFELNNQMELFERSKAEKIERDKELKKIKDEIESIENKLTNIENNKIYDNAFEWRFEFPEVLNDDGDFIGFDVVIGNPPYIKVQELDYLFIDYCKEKYLTAWKRIDISILFIEVSNNILRGCGLNGFITSNQFLTAEYGRKMRQFFLDEAKIIKMIDFGDLPIFQEALTYVSIFILGKGITEKFDYCKVEKLDQKIDTLPCINIFRSSLDDEAWILENEKTNELLFKFKNSFTPLSMYAKCWYGIISGADDILLFEKDQIVNIESEILLPIIRAQDCIRYGNSDPSKYIIYPYIEVDGNTILIDEEVLKDKYPKAYQYLSNFKKQLSSRKDSRKEFGDTGNWYALIRFGKYSTFHQPKIVTPGEVKNNKFCLDVTGSGYSGARVFGITSESDGVDLKILLGILNSKLIEFFLHSVAPLKQGGYYSYSTTFIDSIPLPNNINNCDSDNIKELLSTVDLLLHNNKEIKTMGSDTDKTIIIRDNQLLEQKIDALVYKLYNLIEDEIQIIEDSFK